MTAEKFCGQIFITQFRTKNLAKKLHTVTSILHRILVFMAQKSNKIQYLQNYISHFFPRKLRPRLFHKIDTRWPRPTALSTSDKSGPWKTTSSLKTLESRFSSSLFHPPPLALFPIMYVFFSMGYLHNPTYISEFVRSSTKCCTTKIGLILFLCVFVVRHPSICQDCE
jgi:hypothetical protein